jgi:hypothetical protein
VNHKFSFAPYYNKLTELNFKSNFNFVNDIILMSSKKKKAPPRPMDAIRLMIEDQTLQISDLTEIIKKQGEEIRTLKARLNAKDSLEKERKQKEEAEASSWFWAARTSD